MLMNRPLILLLNFTDSLHHRFSASDPPTGYDRKAALSLELTDSDKIILLIAGDLHHRLAPDRDRK